MNRPFKIIFALIGILLMGITYGIVASSTQNTEGGYLMTYCLSGIVITFLIILFLFSKGIKELDSLKKAALEVEERNNTNFDKIIKELDSLKKAVLEVEERNNTNFYVHNYNMGRLIDALRSQSPIDKEFELKYVLAIARYKLKSKSNLEKEQAILTMWASGRETEVNLLVDIFDKPDLDEKIKTLAKEALKEIFKRAGGESEVNTLIDILVEPNLNEKIRVTTKTSLKEIYKRLEPQ